MTKAYEQINRDTEAAHRGTKPAILVDVYGSNPPDAARHDRGTSTREGAADAQNRRRETPPGSYDHKR
jgi:hypothetical protein